MYKCINNRSSSKLKEQEEEKANKIFLLVIVFYLFFGWSFSNGFDVELGKYKNSIVHCRDDLSVTRLITGSGLLFLFYESDLPAG